MPINSRQRFYAGLMTIALTNITSLAFAGERASDLDSDIYSGDGRAAATLRIIVVRPDDNLPVITVTGSPFAVDWLDSMNSISVIDESLKESIAANRLEDITSYLLGATPSSSQAGFNTAIMLRGFRSSGQAFLNGHRDNHHFLVRDLSTVSRIEILKGHTSVLYGSAAPGGIINYISHQPQAERETMLGLSVGNNDFIRGTLDVTGSLGKSETLSGRLIAASQDGDTLYRNVEDRRWTIFPSFQWLYSDNGVVRLELEYSKDYRPFYFGTVYTQGQILYDQSYVFPQASSDKEYGRVGLYWSSQIKEGADLKASWNHFTTRRDDRHAGFYFKLTDDILRGFYRLVDDDYKQDSVKFELSTMAKTGRLEHQILVGAEYNDDHNDVKSQRNTTGFTLDPFNPDFNVDLDSLPLDDRGVIVDSSESGVFFSDRITLSDSFLIEAGLRHSKFTAAVNRAGNISRTADESNLSGSLGFVWRSGDNAAIHANLSESFEPNFGTDRNDNPFEPKTAQQIELGYRTKLDNNKGSIEAAIYQLIQGNLLTRDPIDPEFNILTGEHRSRGIELLTHYKLTASTRLIAGYSFIDAEFTSDNNGKKGNKPASVPEHAGSIRLDYSPKKWSSLSIFTGVTAVDERFGNNKNSFKVPGYGLLDLGIRYTTEHFETLLTATNVLDKRYVAASFLEDDIYQGNRRGIKLSVEYRL